jgi:GNAT superfamily N-acetyltransferase
VTTKAAETVKITALFPADRPQWSKLWAAYLAFYKTALPDEVFEHTWTRLLQGTELQGLAARADGEIIGITHFLFHGSAWTMTPVCYLQDLFVDDAGRGRGIGRALIEAVAARARGKASTRMYWLTQDQNAVARQLYDRLASNSGFIRYEYQL